MDKENWLVLLKELNRAVARYVQSNTDIIEHMDSRGTDQEIEDHRLAVEAAHAIVSGQDVWLGKPPATELQIVATEARLGRKLPDSYRSFLLVSNGFMNPGPFIGSLLAVEQVSWFSERNGELADVARASSSAYPGVVEGRLESMLQVTSRPSSHDDFYMLDPLETSLDGEWRAYRYQQYGLHAYRTFWDLMKKQLEVFRFLAD